MICFWVYYISRLRFVLTWMLCWLVVWFVWCLLCFIGLDFESFVLFFRFWSGLFVFVVLLICLVYVWIRCCLITCYVIVYLSFVYFPCLVVVDVWCVVGLFGLWCSVGFCCYLWFSWVVAFDLLYFELYWLVCELFCFNVCSEFLFCFLFTWHFWVAVIALLFVILFGYFAYIFDKI